MYAALPYLYINLHMIIYIYFFILSDYLYLFCLAYYLKYVLLFHTLKNVSESFGLILCFHTPIQCFFVKGLIRKKGNDRLSQILIISLQPDVVNPDISKLSIQFDQKYLKYQMFTTSAVSKILRLEIRSLCLAISYFSELSFRLISLLSGIKKIVFGQPWDIHKIPLVYHSSII